MLVGLIELFSRLSHSFVGCKEVLSDDVQLLSLLVGQDAGLVYDVVDIEEVAGHVVDLLPSFPHDLVLHLVARWQFIFSLHLETASVG